MAFQQLESSLSQVLITVAAGFADNEDIGESLQSRYASRWSKDVEHNVARQQQCEYSNTGNRGCLVSGLGEIAARDFDGTLREQGFRQQAAAM
jgi:hypothetical protein